MNKTIIISSLYFFLSFSFAVKAQVSPPPFFLKHTNPLSARITDYAYKDTISSNAALIRLSNQKIAYMTKQNGEMQPFFIKAIETGYWDTRYKPHTNYDTVFKDMRDMGANTAYVMLHWEDIEPSDNHFDFSFSDSIVAAAKRQKIKIQWILFLHAQQDGVPSKHPETAWTFHLDDRDSLNYTMQWPKRKGKVYKNIKDLISNDGIRPLHVYGHPEIFYRIRRMLYHLAIHYRQSKTVIGVQLGNEEGFSFLDKSDYNPVTDSLYQEWKVKTNKTDYTQFKKEAMNWWWKQFTSAYHEGDPYKILSFNLDAGRAEAWEKNRVRMSGTSAATYKDGNLDVIGTMLYKKWGYKALKGLDKTYNGGSYNYQLPILIPSEIGIGNFNTPHDFRNFVMHTLERGAQGFGVYSYGQVRKELPDSLSARKTLTQLFTNIHATEDLVYAGRPGPGFVKCTTRNDAAKISHLNVNKKETLAMVYFPENDKKQSYKQSDSFNLPLNFLANRTGTYTIQIFTKGEMILHKNVDLQKLNNYTINIPKVTTHEVLFISIR